MEPVQIAINEKHIQLGAPLPTTIYHLDIRVMPVTIPIPPEQALLIKAWLNDLVSRLSCDYIQYNGVLIPSDELKKF